MKTKGFAALNYICVHCEHHWTRWLEYSGIVFNPQESIYTIFFLIHCRVDFDTSFFQICQGQFLCSVGLGLSCGPKLGKGL